MTWGDPHFVTLDGRTYDCNGVGEYLFLEDHNQTFQIQIRTKRFSPTSTFKASVISGFAIGVGNDTTVSVYMNPRRIAQVFDGIEEIDLDSVGDGLMINDVLLSVAAVENSTTSLVLTLLLPNGLEIQATVGANAIGLVMLFPESMKNQLIGLLGNWNGDAADDIVSRDGSMMAASNATNEQIFDICQSWLLESVEESLFVYPVGTSFQDFTDISYIPDFTTPEFDKEDIRAAVEAACGSAETNPHFVACMYDGAIGQSDAMAIEGMATVSNYEGAILASNQGPSFHNVPLEFTVARTTTLTYTFEADDLEGDSFVLAMDEGAPMTANINLGVLTWTVPADFPLPNISRCGWY